MPPKKPRAKAAGKSTRKSRPRKDASLSDTCSSVSLSDLDIELELHATPPSRSARSVKQKHTPTKETGKPSASASRKRPRALEDYDSDSSVLFTGAVDVVVVESEGDTPVPSTTTFATVRAAKKQLTLQGEAAPPPTASGKRTQPTRKGATPLSDTVAHRGEIKPSKPSKVAVTAAVLSPTRDEQALAQQYLIDVVFPGMLARSLISAEHLMRVTVTTQGNADMRSNDTGDSPTTTEVEGAAVESGDTEGADDAKEEVGQKWQAQVRAALPCVTDFIFRECHAASVNSGGGESGLVASLTMLGFFTQLLKEQSLAAMLFLACPACRLNGIQPQSAGTLVEFLLTSKRCTADEVMQLTVPELIVALDKSPGGGTPTMTTGTKNNAGTTQALDAISPTHLCACGETHMSLLPVLNRALTPGGVAIDVEWALPASMDVYKIMSETLYNRKCEEVRNIVNLASNIHYASQFNREVRGPPAPKPLTARQLKSQANAEAKEKALLETLKPSWAHDALVHLHKDADCFTKFATRAEQIASATAHALETARTVATVEPHFRFTVQMNPKEPFLSNKGGTLSNPFVAQLRLQSLVWFFSAMSAIAAPGTVSSPLTSTVTSQTQRKKVKPSPSQQLFLLEELDACTRAWRLEKNVTQLAVPKSVVDANIVITKAQEHNKDAYDSSYAAGTHVFSRALHEETWQLDVPGLIRYAATQGTLGFLEDSETSAEFLSPPALIKATLKRHQLENVAWMRSRERNPVAEMIEIPIFSPPYPDCDAGSTTATAASTPTQIGSYFYCATTCEYHVVRAEGPPNQSLYRNLRSAIRGGFLSDDVGLGKTLSVLSLCAADRAAEEAAGTAHASDNGRAILSSGAGQTVTGDELARIGVQPRQWKVAPRAGTGSREGPLFKAAATTTCRFVTHLFPAAFSEELWLPKHHLRQTTLIVVPLSIVGQWIEEVERFYPSATYVLFYGTKRTQFTIEDFARADFVITTYETLAVHLRKECDGKDQLLAEWVQKEDVRFCHGAVTQQKQKQCRPAFLLEAAAQYAMTHVWPTEAVLAPPPPADDDECAIISQFFNAVTLKHLGSLLPPPSDPSRGIATPVVPSRGARRRQRDAEVAAENGITITLDWTMDTECPNHLAVLRGPGNLVIVIEPEVQNRGAGAAQIVKTVRKRKQALSPALLDAVWQHFQQLSSCYPHTSTWPWILSGSMELMEQWEVTLRDVSDWHKNCGLLYILKLATLYPPTQAVQRAITAYVLLPSCAQSAGAYLGGMKSHHYAETLHAEKTGHTPIRILDILFRRVVLDESQKCGSNGLFFLLSGERRWAVSGTPINNANPKSMEGPLQFVGATSAARYLCRVSYANGYRYLGFHHNDGAYLRCKQRALHAQLAAAGHSADALATVLARQYAAPGGATGHCMCIGCVQAALLASVNEAEREDSTWLPTEYQRELLSSQHPQQISQFFSHIVVAILCRFVVRHERDEQMRRELALVPVQHREVPLPLSAAERGLYDPVAQAISDLAALWGRQGLFSAHVGRAQMWLQNLQRLTFHPALQLCDGAAQALAAREGAAVQPPPTTLAELLIRRAAVNFFTDSTHITPNQEELERALLNSFVTMTAAEAVTWAESETLRLRLGIPQANAQGRLVAAPNGAHLVFPEETMDILKSVAEVPPVLPTCGVCMDLMAEPTILTCYHLFCKQCVIDLVESSRNNMTRNIHAKCPYCRDANAMVNEKRVIQPQFHEDGASQVQLELEAAVTETTSCSTPTTEPVAERTPEEQLERLVHQVGVGSRIRGLLDLLESQVWGSRQQQSDSNDGVLVFSKFPAALERVQAALSEAGYKPLMITGGVTLSQRRKIITALSCPATEWAPADDTAATTAQTQRGAWPRSERRILLLTARAANAGLNLTFANHVIFMEPHLNPALETQAIGRAHRFGQTKQVYAYHLYAPNTVDERIYAQSRRARALAEDERQRQQQHRPQLQAPEQNEPNVLHVPVNQMRWQDIHDLLVIPPNQ